MRRQIGAVVTVHLLRRVPGRGEVAHFALAAAVLLLFAFGILAPISLDAATQNGVPAQPPAASVSPAPSAAPLSGPSQSYTPDWQVAAGGHMAFDIVSIKPDSAELSAQNTHSNVPLGPMDSFTPTGGLLESSDFPLLIYIEFAYKLNPAQMQSVQSQLPKWANNARYDIEARASGNPTKDQFRIMMQALLADRFKLAAHWERKDAPVLALVLDKPGKFGPHLQLHPADQPCSTAPTDAGPNAKVAGGFPEQCGSLSVNQGSVPGRIAVGGRDVALSMLASMLGSQPMININKPVIDQTGIQGKIDFTMEFSPEVPPGLGFTPDPNGPTFLEALKDQLGIKMESATARVDSIVIDHIEQPTEN
jgi:uncharacterized protein (TIGR03435 family)